MRNDMTKLVGKSKHSERYVRRVGRSVQEFDNLPTRERMYSCRRYRPNVKNAVPLRRWLNSQVGRPWSKVFAELSLTFDARTVAGHGVREHVNGYVHLKVMEVDGELKAATQWGDVHNIGCDLYVAPDTGLLQRGHIDETYRARTARQREEMRVEREADQVRVSKTRQLHKVDGNWFWVDLAPIEPPKYITPRTTFMSSNQLDDAKPYVDADTVCVDVLTGCGYYAPPKLHSYLGHQLQDLYGMTTHYGVRKYQASSADIRRHVPRTASST